MRTHGILNLGLILLVAGCRSTSARPDPPTPPIIVIGAGVAGLSAALPPDASIRDGIQAFLDDPDDLTDDQRRYASFALTQLLIEIYESGPPDRMSLRAYVEAPYQEFAGGNHVIPGGYVQLANALARGLDIRLDQPVSRIAHDAAGVTVSTPRLTSAAATRS